MAEVILADLVHADCPRYTRCLQERVTNLLNSLGNGTSEPVYVILRQHAGCSEQITETCLSENRAGLNRRVRVLTDSSPVGALYAFKRAVDELNVRHVHVMTCSTRRAELQECEKQLFTELYTFTYSTVLDCTSCPLAQLKPTCPRLTQIKEQISGFLQHLPALRGEIAVLKSSLISGAFH